MIPESYLNDPWIRLRRAGTRSGAGTSTDSAQLKIKAESGVMTDRGPKSGSGAGSRAGFITALMRSLCHYCIELVHICSKVRQPHDSSREGYVEAWMRTSPEGQIQRNITIGREVNKVFAVCI